LASLYRNPRWDSSSIVSCCSQSCLERSVAGGQPRGMCWRIGTMPVIWEADTCMPLFSYWEALIRMYMCSDASNDRHIYHQRTSTASIFCVWIEGLIQVTCTNFLSLCRGSHISPAGKEGNMSYRTCEHSHLAHRPYICCDIDS